MKHRKTFYLTIMLLLLYHSKILYSIENSILKKYINFDQFNEKGEVLSKNTYQNYRELFIWANYNMMTVEEDSGFYDLKDNICRVIPIQGLEFYLTVDSNIKKKTYLYLDLVRYKFEKNSTFKMNRYLNVYINGKFKIKIIQNKNSVLDNIIQLELSPEDISSGVILIELFSDLDSNFWCIWDTFYSYVDLKKGE